MVLLFIGLAFLLRYASERVAVPVEYRYAGVALAAMALLGVGWWLRERRAAYGLILQGTGIAVLYLTIFAAMRLHPLISPGAALALLVVVTICSAILAVLQNAMGLAVVAALGGFAAPILTSTGSGNHVALFSYFALLNAGIFAIAWFRAWRPLNLVGFVGTFGIGFAWGLRSYTPELFASTEPFLALFFLMYVGIGLLFARRKLLEAAQAPAERGELLRWSARQADYIDATVLFGPPLVGFGLQCAVIGHIDFGMAFSALALGLFYMVLARVLRGHASAGRTSLLVEICLALGVVFGTLAIPLGLDARWTSAAWAVEGAGIYWLGLHQQRRLARLFALLLQGGAALAYLNGVRPGETTLLEGSPLGALMLGAAALFSFWQLRRAPAKALADWEPACRPLLAAAGLAFLYLVAPLCLAVDSTAIAWAVAGLASLFAGLRLGSRTFLFCAFAVQLLGGALFLLHLQGGDGQGGVFDSGWRGLMTASLIGLALIGGMLLAARDPLVKDDSRLLMGLSLVLLAGLAFVNLAVLFVLPWRSASAVWAGSGLLIIWLSLVLRQRLSFYFGLALQVVGGLAFLLAGPSLFGSLSGEGLRPLAHSGFWTPAVLALAALVGAWRLRRAGERERALGIGTLGLAELSHLLLLWGAGWWALTALCETVRFVPYGLREHALLLVAAATVASWMLLALRERWRELALLCLALVPVALLALASAWRFDYQPFGEFGWLAWPLLFATHLLSLRRLAPLLPAKALSVAHVLGCWLLLGVLALELRYLFALLAEQYNAWRWLGWALVPSAYLLLVAGGRSLPWPLRDFAGVSAARRCAGGAVAARLVLERQPAQRRRCRAAALPAAGQPAGTGAADRAVRPLPLERRQPGLARRWQCQRAPGAPGVGRRLAVRPADPGGVPRRASPGRRTVPARGADRVDAGAGGAVAGLDALCAGPDHRRYPSRPARPVDGRRGAGRRRGGQAVLRRAGQQWQPGANHLLHRGRRPVAGRRLLLTLASASRRGRIGGRAAMKRSFSFRTAGLLLLGACLSLPLSAKESAEGFSRQVALSLQGEGPWYRLSIPMSVQLSAAHADLRDLRVFDAEGEALPYALVAGSERQASTPHEAEVRLFPLRGTSAADATQPNLRVQRNTSGTIVEVLPENAGPAAETLRGWLIDASAVTFPLERLRLDWSSPEEGFQRFSVEASDDLEHWQAWGTDRSPA